MLRLPRRRREIAPEPGERAEIEDERGLELERLDPDVDVVDRPPVEEKGDHRRRDHQEQEDGGAPEERLAAPAFGVDRRDEGDGRSDGARRAKGYGVHDQASIAKLARRA